jgi:hypothetical protein
MYISQQSAVVTMQKGKNKKRFYPQWIERVCKETEMLFYLLAIP